MALIEFSALKGIRVYGLAKLLRKTKEFGEGASKAVLALSLTNPTNLQLL